MHFPSAFTLVCMNWLIKESEKALYKSHKSRREKAKVLSVTVRRLNRHLMNIQRAMNPEVEKKMEETQEKEEIESGVDVMMGRRNRSRRDRTRWDHSPSRSSSSSSESSSSSSSRDRRSRSLSSERSRSYSPYQPPQTEAEKKHEEAMKNIIGEVHGLSLDTANFFKTSLAALCQGILFNYSKWYYSLA